MDDQHGLLSLVADIVSAHVSNNKVATAEVASLIQSTYAALEQAGSPAPAAAAPQEPAVSIKASVKPDYIVCLECGAKQKMIKRHIMSAHGLTVDDYRAKWSLPRTYPLVSSNYAAQRSSLAHEHGLGIKGGRKKAVEDVKATSSKVSESIKKAREHLSGDAPVKAPAKRGRPPKAKATEA